MTVVQSWTQERPSWCPHTDCLFRLRVQDSLCGGELPKPESHDSDENTHRLCINADEVFDLQVNRSDLYHFRRVLSALDGRAQARGGKG